jgi:MFS family permease
MTSSPLKTIRRPRMLLRPDNPLRQPAFRRLFGGHLVSLAGDQIFPVAMVALAIERGGRPAETISVIFAARFLALALFLIVGGVIADRVNRITGMIVLDIARAGVVVALIVIGSGTPLTVLAAFTFMLGAGEAIFTPLYESVLPDLAEASVLQRANALSSLVKNLATVVGPGVAGVLVAVIGVRASLAIDVATFAVSVLAVARLRRQYGRAGQSDAASMPAWRAAAEGVSVVLRQRWLAALEGMAVVQTLFAVGPWYVLVPVLAVQRYGSVADYGLLLAAFGMGGVIGAMAGAQVSSGRRGLIALAGIGTFGLACLIEGWRVPVYVVCLVFVIAGFGTQMFDVVKTTAIQETVERQYLGRAFSLDFFASFVAIPFGQMIGGLVVAHVSAATVMRVCGVSVIVTTLLPALVPGAAAFRNPSGTADGNIPAAARVPPRTDATP